MKLDSANMKIVSIALCAVLLVLCFDCTTTQTTPSNGTRKLQVSENANPQVSYGVAFDEITVESNLNIRGKPPGSRTQRTQLFPVKQSNNTNENKPNNIKLANA